MKKVHNDPKSKPNKFMWAKFRSYRFKFVETARNKLQISTKRLPQAEPSTPPTHSPVVYRRAVDLVMAAS